MSSDLFVVGLSRMAYGETLALQRTLAEARIAGRATNDMLLLVEHPPVVTLGRSFEKKNLYQGQKNPYQATRPYGSKKILH